MALVVYVAGIALAALLVFVIPFPWGAVVALGLLFGGLWRLHDRVSHLETKLGITDPPEDLGPNPGAEAERRRVRKALGMDRES